MTEEQVLKDNSTKVESSSEPVLPEADKKRVTLGTILGGSMFLAILIAVIILVSTEEAKPPHPVPPKPVKKVQCHNPFVVIDESMPDDKTVLVLLLNNRTAIENSWNNTDPKNLTSIPIIRNTTENPEPNQIRVIAKSLDEHLFNIKYLDTEWERWQVPDYGSNEDPYAHASRQIRTPIGFHILRTRTFEWVLNGWNLKFYGLVDTQNCRLQYYDKYIEFEMRMQSDYIYGMGERIESFHLKNDNYSLWNKHYAYDLGSDSETGTFSSHPFFLNRLKDSKDFIGVYMRNSNAMLFSLWHALNNGTTVNYKMIGGIIDLYIIHAADPDYILKKYHSLIGRPYLPPVWAMGLQQARSGYTLQDIKTVVEHHQQERIPIDAVWAENEINDGYKSYTVDSGRFGGVKEFVQKMHDPHEGIDMRFVVIANPGLKKEVGYKYYDQAVKENCLIKSAVEHDQPFTGRTIAGSTVWLDYFVHPATIVVATGLHEFHDQTLLDGVFMFDNEVNQYCDGECAMSSDAEGEAGIPNPFHNQSEFDYIQYRPTLDPLERNTIAMAAYHDGDPFFLKQYYTHNLFGLQSAKAAYDSLYGIFEDKRFLVASRSTWPGSGQFSSHFIGENYATWDSMLASIAGILNFNMFGIPHVGAPIGGYYGNTTSEMLARWFELGCFYPLMLSYSNSNTNHKEAYFDPEIKDYIKNALLERYSLLRFMYTKMFEAYAWGGAVVHPLFFEFPDHEEVYKREIVDRTFMWGKTLYVIPALIKGQVRTRAYLPNWRWYDLRTREMVVDYKEGGYGEYVTFDQPLGHITVLVKGGSIIPYQYMARDAKIMNVEDLKLIPALIIVCPDHQGKAQGTMVVDSEGIRPHPDPMSHTYRHYAFTYMNSIFRINKLAGFDFHEVHEYDYFWELLILDTFGKGHVSFACMMDTQMQKKELQFWKPGASPILMIHDDRMAKIPMFNLESIVWGTPDDHDFCKFEVHASSVNYQDGDKTLVAELATSDPEAHQMKFDLKASLLFNGIVSMQISMNDRRYKQWIVPDVVDDSIRRRFGEGSMQGSGFKISPLGSPFYFEFADPVDPHDFFFTTKNLPFVYVKNFMHIKFMVSSRHIFGLGERVGKFELGDGIYSLWANDYSSEETGIPPGNNMYGSHPFYLVHLHNPNLFAGIFFLNSNAIDVKIRHVGMQTQIDHIFCGGIIDAFFIQKGSGKEVLRNYHELIGRPVPLPYWAFGYHHSRWGYRDITHLQDVVHKFDTNNIPLDVVWMDKDYMDRYRSFTVNKQNWYGLEQFIKGLHDKGKHFVAIVDAGIAMDPYFDLYNDGLARGVYLHNGPDKKNLVVGVTWPGYTVWIDYLHPSAEAFWEECISKLYSLAPFDGLWLDMNEPSNFCDGECPDETHYNYYLFPLDFYDDLYYNPTHRPLEKGTISMEAVHYGDAELNIEFNYHNLYGLLQSRATARFFFNTLRKRPFIISSSTFPGSGRFASHWLGDNYSSWHYMEYSIAGMFNFQLFGIPFVGADICGFSGNATMNLCSRWYQLGAFYPFMRNHNNPNGSPQEPYIDSKLASIARKAIHMRYTLVRYIYSEYMHTALYGGLIVKPVMFDFPSDPMTYSILDTTFMFGNSIRVTPVLEDRIDTLVSYFPNVDWFEYPSFKRVMSHNASSKTGQNLTLHCALDAENINLHIRAGTIFPYQDNVEVIGSVLKLLEHPVKLVVVPDHNLQARGGIYYDDEHPTNFREDHHDYNIVLNGSEVKFALSSGAERYKYPNKDETVTQIIVLNARHYENTQCVKLVDKTDKSTKYLKHEFKREQEQLILLPPDGYEMTIPKIDTITWYNTTC